MDADESDETAAPGGIVPPTSPEPPVTRRQPLWTYFLTPIAILVGAVMVSGTIWYLDDESDASTPTAASGTEAVVSTDAIPTTAAGTTGAVSPNAAPRDLLTAFRGYAAELSIDQAQFQTCLSKSSNVDLINKHLQRGSEYGVTGTPTFVINNKLIVGAQPAAIFDEIIQRELAGSPTSLDAYSGNIQALAATNPPRFQILDKRPDISDTYIEGGGANAKVIVAEFSDFQCPFCKRWGDTYISKLRSYYPDVALAFIHFPIAQLHPNAANASAAALCAGEQGKFWLMHDILFGRQQEWEGLPVQ